MKPQYFFVPLATLLLLAGVLLYFFPQTPNDPYAINNPNFGGDIVLPASSFDLKNYRGKIALIYFGYTHCPDICPTTLGTMAQAVNKLSPEQQKNIVGIFISVDPARDSPEQLKAYSQFFHPNFIGVTGEIDQLRELIQRYRGYFQINAPKAGEKSYSVDHTGSIYVINRQGQTTHVLAGDAGVDALSQVLQSFFNKEML